VDGVPSIVPQVGDGYPYSDSIIAFPETGLKYR
jgi:hypothetical protein